EPAAARAARRGTLAALQDGPACPVRFVAQEALPPGMAYESYIATSGCCPVREGLHDFFNGLCWQLFPRSKRRLNQLQAQAIAEQGGVQRRGAVRDAITVLDENGALLLAPQAVLQALWPALRAHDWHTALVARRALWQQARVLPFGHALLEKLVAPRKGITTHLLAIPVAAGDPGALLATDTARADALLEARLAPAWLAAKPYTPLPVLGVPGWHAANAQESFYDDASVFRPARQQERGPTAPLHNDTAPGTDPKEAPGGP
ncbi:MAG: DUF3025 domain-containing protein, partial [Comamonas sp.]